MSAAGDTARVEAVTARAIERAQQRIGTLIRPTPVMPAGEISRRVGAPVTLKPECLQRTGSFKIRGAANRIAGLGDSELAAGVVAASAGNHAQAVALAARLRGAGAHLFMPADAPLAKVAAVRSYGGDVHQVEGSYDEADEAARGFADREGAVLVHPFDDPEVVAGQGTIGLEIASEAPATRLIVAALGGGGMVSGTAIAAGSKLPGVRVVGVQAEACAPYPRSLAAKRPIGARSKPEEPALRPESDSLSSAPRAEQEDLALRPESDPLVSAPRGVNTICDGIAVKRPGELTLPLVAEHVDEVVTVSDDEVAEAMVLLLERSKLVVEGAGAASVAALLAGKVAPPDGGEVCAILSGGNVDASRLVECIRLGETAAARRLVLVTVVPDRPGALAGLLRVVAEQGANVIDVAHLREGVDLHVRETAVRLVLQTQGSEHGRELVAAIESEGFATRVERSMPAD